MRATSRSSSKTRARVRSRLHDTQSQLAQAQQGKQEAEARAAAAMSSLSDVANVKEEQRGTVITLSGAVLFPSGGDTLSEVARQSLDKVAQALQEQSKSSHIRIEGYTDARGSDSANQALSQRRAQAVRDYLASRGLDGLMLEAVGRGEANAIASNDSADGRASNRRVEIVVEPAVAQTQAGNASPGKNEAPASAAKNAP